jgi:hypothetical protein
LQKVYVLPFFTTVKITGFVAPADRFSVLRLRLRFIGFGAMPLQEHFSPGSLWDPQMGQTRYGAAMLSSPFWFCVFIKQLMLYVSPLVCIMSLERR